MPKEPEITYLSNVQGVRVYTHSNHPGKVFKEGPKVKRREAIAMRLVARFTDIPIPKLFPDHVFGDYRGLLVMSRVEGSPLSTCWDSLDNDTKRCICEDTWGHLGRLRAIPNPMDFVNLFLGSTEGSLFPARAVVEARDDLSQISSQYPGILNMFRRWFMNHIERWERRFRFRKKTPYHNSNAMQARNGPTPPENNDQLRISDLLPILPDSSGCVFTHGDIAPRNIMVDDKFQITAILDWEVAGWYPEYWEYMCIYATALEEDTDWTSWMEHTAPERWDKETFSAAIATVYPGGHVAWRKDVF